jgi:hypothetical protein
MGSFLLGLPEPLRSIRHVPILGNLAHRLSHRFLPKDDKVCARVEQGSAEGLWLKLNSRTGQHYLHGDVARHPLILCEMHSDLNDKYLREYFVRFGYSIESVDDLHILAVPRVAK